MKSHTSLVAQQTRLSEWADLIRDCQNRPQGMKIDEWCQLHDITKVFRNYDRTARQNCGEQIRISSFASYTIVIRNGCTSPINLHSISGFMCDTHRCFCEPCPFAIFVTKLRVHVWRQLRCIAIGTVFRS